MPDVHRGLVELLVKLAQMLRQFDELRAENEEMSRRLAQVVETKENQSRLIEDLEAAKMNVTNEVQRTRYDVETSVNFLTSLLALVGRPVRSSDGHSLGQLQQSVHTAVVEMTGELERAQVDLSSLHSQVAVLEGRVGDMDQVLRQEELLEADNEQLERVNKAAQQEVDELSAALEEARQTARSLQLEANQAADAVSTHQSASHASATSSGTWSSSRSAPQTARPPRLS